MIMNKNIFVINDNNIDQVSIEIDIDKLNNIIKEIDKFYGKGILKQTTSPYFYSNMLNDNCNDDKKIEIISKTKEYEKNTICGTHIDNSIIFYKYEYYEFVPHDLSIICSNIISSMNDILKLSIYLNELLKIKLCDDNEKNFARKILSTIKISSKNANYTNNLRISKNCGILRKCKSSLIKKYNRKKNNKKFDFAINNNNLLKKNSEYDRNQTKKMVMTLLPSYNKLLPIYKE